MKILLKLFISLVFFPILLLTGCSSNISNISKDIKNAFLKEEKLKVAVKKAYITEQIDAKSKIIKEVNLDDELLVIGLIENDFWFEVLTPNIRGYIPKNAMIEISIINETGNILGVLWSKMKNNKDTTKTSYDGDKKDWSNPEKVRKHVKGFNKDDKTEEAMGLNTLKSRYDEKYINDFFASLSKQINDRDIQNFRESGGLN